MFLSEVTISRRKKKKRNLRGIKLQLQLQLRNIVLVLRETIHGAVLRSIDKLKY